MEIRTKTILGLGAFVSAAIAVFTIKNTNPSISINWNDITSINDTVVCEEAKKQCFTGVTKDGVYPEISLFAQGKDEETAQNDLTYSWSVHNVKDTSTLAGLPECAKESCKWLPAEPAEHYFVHVTVTDGAWWWFKRKATTKITFQTKPKGHKNNNDLALLATEADVVTLQNPETIVQLEDAVLSGRSLALETKAVVANNTTVASWEDTTPQPANAGTSGSRGSHGRAHSGDNGASGDSGISGISGAAGKDSKNVSIDTALLEGTLTINASAMDGQIGGDGGMGGNGGDGGSGRNGSSGVFDCRRGPGSGGNGGNAGAGGDAGSGGNGGNAGDITVEIDALAPDTVIELIAKGGKAGQAGVSGASGTPGQGGPRGSAPGLCGVGGAGRGNNGVTATAGATGTSGKLGKDGYITLTVGDDTFTATGYLRYPSLKKEEEISYNLSHQ